MTTPVKKNPRPVLAESHPAKFLTRGMLGCNTCWIFAAHANFRKQYAPHMVNPPLSTTPLGAEVADKLRYVTQAVYNVPEGYDPWWYAYDFLHIDPLLIVTDLKDLELETIHQYGYFQVDIPGRKVTAVYPINDKGIILDAYRERRGPFLPIETITQYPSASNRRVFSNLWDGTLSSLEPSTVESQCLDTATDLKEGVLALPVGARPLHSTLATREVDWKGTMAYWMKLVKDTDSLIHLRWLYLNDRELYHRFGIDDPKVFDTFDPSLKRDILLLPELVIDAEGQFHDYRGQRLSIAKAQRWDELKDHYRQCREKIGAMMGPLSPVEMFVGAYSLELLEKETSL